MADLIIMGQTLNGRLIINRLVALEGQESLKSDPPLTEVPAMKPSTQAALESEERVPLQLQPTFFRIQVNPRSTQVGWIRK